MSTTTRYPSDERPRKRSWAVCKLSPRPLGKGADMVHPFGGFLGQVQVPGFRCEIDELAASEDDHDCAVGEAAGLVLFNQP